MNVFKSENNSRITVIWLQSTLGTEPYAADVVVWKIRMTMKRWKIYEHFIVEGEVILLAISVELDNGMDTPQSLKTVYD